MEAKFIRKILEPKKSLGAIFKKKRLDKKINLKKISQLTLIRYPYLLNLEKNNFKSLPPEPYGSFFVKRYAEFLGLDSDYYVLWYQREVNILPDESQVRPPEEIKFSIWSFLRRRLRFFLLAIIIFFGLSIFLSYEVIGFTKGPYLKIISPTNEEVFIKDSLYKIRGITDKESTVSLNGKLIDIKDGTFEEEVILKPGRNQFLVEATDNLNKKTQISLLLWRLD